MNKLFEITEIRSFENNLIKTIKLKYDSVLILDSKGKLFQS